MHPSVDIGIQMMISIFDLRKHTIRLLGSSPIIEIDERFAIDFFLQYGEISTYIFNFLIIQFHYMSIICKSTYFFEDTEL